MIESTLVLACDLTVWEHARDASRWPRRCDATFTVTTTLPRALRAAAHRGWVTVTTPAQDTPDDGLQRHLCPHHARTHAEQGSAPDWWDIREHTRNTARNSPPRTPQRTTGARGGVA